MRSKIEEQWYKPVSLFGVLLSPLSCFFSVISSLRRALYKYGIFSVKKISCPLIVVGNVSVGGTGKTPLTQYLLTELIIKKIKIGVVSRGYGRRDKDIRLVLGNSTAEEVGDEPLLLSSMGVPVAVGADRYCAAQMLLKHNPKLDLIISDDGLQHYRLYRDLEIALVDCTRGFGNKFLLPAGPLREPISRLKSVDAIVLNGQPSATNIGNLPSNVPRFNMQLKSSGFYCLHKPTKSENYKYFAKLKVVALASIGNPERFFSSLLNIGVNVSEKFIFADHHIFSAEELPKNADAIIVTSKDAVKLRKFNDDRIWVMPVIPEVTPDLASWLLTKLDIIYGC